MILIDNANMKKKMKNLLRVSLITGLWPLEKILLRQSSHQEYPVCFIIGPPRSGTTLIYELLARSFSFAYISNFANQLAHTPVAATALGFFLIRKWQKRNAQQFSNKYGIIPGWGAPNEGGRLWNQWFPRDYYLDESHISNVPVSKVRSIIGGLCQIMKGPFLNKNVMHSVHIRLLDQIFPGCIFIHIIRDPAMNIASIIDARLKIQPNPEELREWWSVKPPEWERYKEEDLVVRSCAQVYYTNKCIERDIRLLGSNRIITISYEKLCAQPTKTIDAIADFLHCRNTKLKLTEKIPESFPMRNQESINSHLLQRITEGIDFVRKSDRTQQFS